MIGSSSRVSLEAVSPGRLRRAYPPQKREGLMSLRIPTALSLLAGFAGLLAAGPLLAQACKDDESVVQEYTKSLGDFVQTIRKESQSDFDRGYHHKSCLTKLTFSKSAIDGLLSCLDKAAQDTAAPKEETEAAKAKRATYAKLKDRVDGDRKALKDASDSKQAKTLIEKFNFSL